MGFAQPYAGCGPASCAVALARRLRHGVAGPTPRTRRDRKSRQAAMHCAARILVSHGRGSTHCQYATAGQQRAYRGELFLGGYPNTLVVPLPAGRGIAHASFAGTNRAPSKWRVRDGLGVGTSHHERVAEARRGAAPPPRRRCAAVRLCPYAACHGCVRVPGRRGCAAYFGGQRLSRASGPAGLEDSGDGNRGLAVAEWHDSTMTASAVFPRLVAIDTMVDLPVVRPRPLI